MNYTTNAAGTLSIMSVRVVVRERNNELNKKKKNDRRFRSFGRMTERRRMNKYSRARYIGSSARPTDLKFD